MAKIGKYEIVDELGRGGMGVVYKAFDSLMERDVAIKVISDIMLAVPEIKARFYREARMAGKLAHDNITVVYEIGEDEGRPYIVMEYLEGDDLETLLARHEPISFLQKLDYAIQICRGLSFSHSREIIHRDIKPANIRIVGNGKVKIMDFGIARPMSSTITTTGVVIGTPFYMSPEQIQGRKVDRRSDIFSFGVLLYELLVGKKPFTGDEPTSVMFKIVYEEPEWIDDTRIDHRNGLRDVVMKCLAKDPDNRYQDLAEVADTLENIVADLKGAERKRAEEIRIRVGKLLSESRGLLKRNDLPKAREAAQEAARIDPANTDIARLRNEIAQAEEREARRRLIEQKLKEARLAFEAADYDRTQGILRDLLALQPDHPEALRLTRAASDAALYAKTADPRYAETSRPGETLLLTPEQQEQLSQQSRPSEPERTQPEAAVQPAALPEQEKAEPAAAGAAVMQPAVQAQPRREALRPGLPKTKRKAWRYVIAAVVAIAVVAAGLYRTFLYVAPPPDGYVLLNILPWAEVTQVVSASGKEVPLNARTLTPCRLALPEGSYQIHCANPSYGLPLVLAVSVKKGQGQEVKKTFPGFDARRVLAAFQ